MRRVRIAVWLILCFVASGCGYQLAGGQAPPSPVIVDTLDNDSLEPGIEIVLASALRRELASSPSFRLVDRGGDAYRVAGTVTAVDTLGRTFTPGVRALEFTVTVRLSLDVRGPGGAGLPFDRFASEASEIYLASTDIEISRKNREEALRRVSALLARRIHDELARTREVQSRS